MTIIKSFPRGYFYRDKESPLSSSMVIALKKAFAWQKRREPFGPIDIKSLYPLIERGLISLISYKIMGEKKATWFVTKKGRRTFYATRGVKPWRLKS
ncbi:MAG: hypothetical protein ABI416_19675 [Ginsengibacter sp.]